MTSRGDFMSRSPIPRQVKCMQREILDRAPMLEEGTNKRTSRVRGRMQRSRRDRELDEGRKILESNRRFEADNQAQWQHSARRGLLYGCGVNAKAPPVCAARGTQSLAAKRADLAWRQAQLVKTGSEWQRTGGNDSVLGLPPAERAALVRKQAERLRLAVPVEMDSAASPYTLQQTRNNERQNAHRGRPASAPLARRSREGQPESTVVQKHEAINGDRPPVHTCARVQDLMSTCPIQKRFYPSKQVRMRAAARPKHARSWRHGVSKHGLSTFRLSCGVGGKDGLLQPADTVRHKIAAEPLVHDLSSTARAYPPQSAVADRNDPRVGFCAPVEWTKPVEAKPCASAFNPDQPRDWEPATARPMTAHDAAMNAKLPPSPSRTGHLGQMGSPGRYVPGQVGQGKRSALWSPDASGCCRDAEVSDSGECDTVLKRDELDPTQCDSHPRKPWVPSCCAGTSISPHFASHSNTGGTNTFFRRHSAAPSRTARRGGAAATTLQQSQRHALRSAMHSTKPRRSSERNVSTAAFVSDSFRGEASRRRADERARHVSARTRRSENSDSIETGAGTTCETSANSSAAGSNAGNPRAVSQIPMRVSAETAMNEPPRAGTCATNSKKQHAAKLDASLGFEFAKGTPRKCSKTPGAAAAVNAWKSLRQGTQLNTKSHATPAPYDGRSYARPTTASRGDATMTRRIRSEGPRRVERAGTLRAAADFAKDRGRPGGSGQAAPMGVGGDGGAGIPALRGTQVIVSGATRPKPKQATHFLRSTTVQWDTSVSGHHHLVQEKEKRAKEMARRRALRHDSCELLQENKAFAILPVDVFFEQLRAIALQNFKNEMRETAHSEVQVAGALAETASLEAYVARGVGADESTGTLDEVDDDGQSDVITLPPLLITRGQFVSSMQQCGIGRVPRSLKLLNRVFSSFDIEALDQLDVVEFCYHFLMLRQKLAAAATPQLGMAD